jgi:prepilin-type N-terminal cleavage/methylation domain-containing protein
MKKTIGIIKSNQGFTLVEVMLSVAIVSMALVLLIQSFAMIGNSYFSASHYTKAILLLDKKIHDVQSGVIKGSKLSDSFEVPFEGYQWKINQQPVFDNNYRKLQIQVSWDQRTENDDLAISTIVRRFNEKK